MYNQVLAECKEVRLVRARRSRKASLEDGRRGHGFSQTMKKGLDLGKPREMPE